MAILLRAYGLVEQKTIDAVLDLAPRPHNTQPGLCNDDRPGVRDRLAASWCVATAVRTFTDSWLPPAVQTPAYAQAFAKAHPSTERYYGPGSFRFPVPTPQRPLTLLMGEAALYPPAVAPNVMTEQLAHLHKLVEKLSLRVGLVPASRPQPFARIPTTELILERGPLYACQTLTATHHSVLYSNGRRETERARLDLLEEIAEEECGAFLLMHAATRRMELTKAPAARTAKLRTYGRDSATRNTTAGAPVPAAWRVTGLYFRALRTEKGLRQVDAARLIGSSTTSVCNLENGKTEPRPDVVTRLLREYGITDPQELRSATRFACEAAPEAQHDSGPGASDRLTVCWRAAQTVVVHTDSWLPPAVQTPAYAQAYDANHARTPRLGPGSFTYPAPNTASRTTLLIGEAVLRRPLGGPAVMRAQLAHLLDLVDADRLVVRIVPFTSGQMLGRRTTELMLPDGLLYALEEPGGVTYRADQGPAPLLERLQQAALTPEATAAQIDLARRTFTPRPF
ncbi:Scr1 family TA system antitoxin-like transcriptional regulator [Streptomyces niveus]|uniref:Scr1 family TA system antitoxin-like transcriptional regulator n=1 Tax=Streptomyces niveus TaxID=193462 RepID=UPI00341D31AE